MRKFLKILFAFVVLVVGGVTAAVMLIPREQVVALAADQVRAVTGRELVMTGDISPSFWPILGVRTGAVRLSNADWAEAADMVSASAAEIGVELMPLFSGEVKVAALRLIAPVVALEIGADGRPNWQFGDGAGHGGGSGADLPKIALPEAVIENGSISFHDARTGQRIELAALDLTVGLAGMEAPLTLDGAGIWNGKRASVTALVDTPAAAMQGRPVAVKLSLASDPASLGFEGTLHLIDGAALPQIDGAVSANLSSPAAAIAWATGAGAPAGLEDIGAVKLEGTLAASDAGLRLKAKGSAGYRDRAVAYDLTADGGAGWLDRQAFAVAVTAASKGLFEMSFSGPVSGGAAPAAEGPLKVTVADLQGLAEWTSGAALDTPAGSFETAALDTHLTLRDGDRLDFADLSMRVDNTALTGVAGVDLGGKRPAVMARLDSGPLDLSPFMAGDGGRTSGGAGSSAGWSTEPLDLSALRSVDADVTIRAEAVDLGQIEIGRSDIAARLRDGRLDMDIRRVDAYGGGMSGTVAVVAGSDTQIATDVTISQVQMRPLLNAMAGIDNLEGLGAFRLRAEGQGSSMDALVRSLNGDGAFELTDGAILGMNLAAMVRNLTGQGGGLQRTDFSAVSGTFAITDGVLHNTDFTFLGPLLRVVGAGTVDLGAQSQNFRLEPTAVASLTGQGGTLADSGLGIFPILITGTWSNPSIRPDLTGAIEGLLTDPNKTLDKVTGLVNNADPGQAAGALIGAVTGGSAEPDSPAGVLGQALGGLLGGKRSSSGGSSGGGSGANSGGGDTVAQPTYGGGLLGTLTGGGSAPESTVPQPSYGGEAGSQSGTTGSAPEFDASEFAPALAPLPRPAAPGRESLAALPADQSGQAVGTALPDVGSPGTPPPEPALVPAPELVPAPTPEPAPAAAATPEPAPEPAPDQAEPQPAPEPAAAATEASGAASAPEADGNRKNNQNQDNQSKRKRERDGGLTLDQILKGIQK